MILARFFIFNIRKNIRLFFLSHNFIKFRKILSIFFN
nr:MAG TPA: hypothetical protein [Bacteriophage sp.]